MKPINRNNSTLRRSQIATDRIERLIPILEDCFKNCSWVDEYARAREQVIEMLNDIKDNEQYHRLSVEFPDDCAE